MRFILPKDMKARKKKKRERERKTRTKASNESTFYFGMHKKTPIVEWKEFFSYHH